MAHNLVDVNTWTAAVTVPDDGDAFNGAAFEAGMQDLGDRTLYLRKRSVCQGSTFVLPIQLGYAHANVANRFTADYGAGAMVGTWVQSDVTTQGGLWLPLYLPINNGTISTVTLYCTGLYTAGAHAGAIASMPGIELVSANMLTGTWTSMGSQVDTTVAPATYDMPHTIVLSGLTASLSNTAQHFLLVLGESGANSAANKFGIFGASATITPT